MGRLTERPAGGPILPLYWFKQPFSASSPFVDGQSLVKAEAAGGGGRRPALVTVDGRLGKVFEGALPVEKPDENDSRSSGLVVAGANMTASPARATLRLVRIVDDDADADAGRGAFSRASESFAALDCRK